MLKKYTYKMRTASIQYSIIRRTKVVAYNSECTPWFTVDFEYFRKFEWKILNIRKCEFLVKLSVPFL